MENSLLDTNILSQPLKPKPHEAAIRWLVTTPRAQTFLSVVTIQETRTGLDMIKDMEKKQRLEAWFARVRRRYDGRILPVTEEVAEVAGTLVARLRKDNVTIGANDILIAATAAVHNLQIVTLNRKDFERLGVLVVDF